MEIYKLKNPPIVEAIIGVQLNKDYHHIKALKNIYDASLNKKYPIINNCTANQIGFNLEEKAGFEYKQERGLKLSNEDKNQIIFLEKNRVSLSQLPPYTSGDDLIEKYEEIWGFFSEHIKIDSLKGIEVRYINKFELEEEKLEDYFKIKLEKGETDFEMPRERLVARYDTRSQRYNANATINTIVQKINNEKVSIIFDIDTHEFNVSYNNFGTIKDTLYRLREFKNKIFFSNLPKAKELWG